MSSARSEGKLAQTLAKPLLEKRESIVLVREGKRGNGWVGTK